MSPVAHPAYGSFRGRYDFDLDEFQQRACLALEDGHAVLVAAPTGSGKTVVGEFAVHLARTQGTKCFYTTPIKALSNQKYADLVRQHGAESVGLLTGDNTINGEASVVVMTTEVLRNMLYARSPTLTGLRYVVMDEVHYLADRLRGPVWEEVILHLPESVALVSLSATVSNAEEFGDWLRSVRGDTVIVVEERRPVPLYQHVLLGRHLLDLFAGQPGGTEAGRLNPQLERVAREDLRTARLRGAPRSGGKGRRRGGSPYSDRQRGRPRAPSRVEVVQRLEREALLPAIVFIFSRAGCDAAVEQCVAAGTALTTPEEERQIRSYVDEHCASIPDADLQVLRYPEFVASLARGVARHHAGMLPTFKECVEVLFSRGRLKVVFATETLALGINMPARSVVLEQLTKWNGETHADVTPGEYTQLTGRAGRRGIDVEGHGVVLWQSGLDPRHVAGLASTRTYPLRSSFRPSYNMAVNLVRADGRARSRRLLESSFAQFQADRAVVGLVRELRRSEEALRGYAGALECDRGDVGEYLRLSHRLSELETAQQQRRHADRRHEVVGSLEALRRGDVIEVPAGRWAGTAVVLDPGSGADRDGPRPLVLTLERQARRLSVVDFPTPVGPLGRMRVPQRFNPRNPQMRRDLASSLRARLPSLAAVSPTASDVAAGDAAETVSVRAQLRAHPCDSCPRRDEHARWAERHRRLRRDADALRRRIDARTGNLAKQFDRVCEVLTELEYLAGDTVTPAGLRLARLYSELDLVAAECLQRGAWDGLTPPELAACVSGLVYETRSAEDVPEPRLPGAAVPGVVRGMTALWEELSRLERGHGVSFLRRPDFGFAYSAYSWASGADLDLVLADADLAAGDFVRSVKALLDVLDQVAQAAGSGELRTTARAAANALNRGVVAYTSLRA